MTDSDRNREGLFEAALYTLYERIWRECGYRAERFRQLIDPAAKRYCGGVAAARRLIWSETIGFGELVTKGRFDLTVEALVTSPEWATLFSMDEIRYALLKLEWARQRRGA